METMCSTVFLIALYSSLAGRFSNNYFSSLPYGRNLDLSFPTGRVNGVNPIRRFWHLLCKLEKDVADFKTYSLTDENPDVNTDGIFMYHDFMV
jgi:hypothetical protein